MEVYITILVTIVFMLGMWIFGAVAKILEKKLDKIIEQIKEIKEQKNA